MSSFYLRSGNSFRVTDKANIDIHETLPPGYYTVSMDMKGFFLEGMEPFTPEKKIYGAANKNANRIFNTFKNRRNSTGVLLTGEKGSGKTLLARELAIKGVENNIPCLVVNSPFCGDGFNQFVQDIDQEVIMIFDEFEKVYNEGAQASMLTLLDGTFQTKKLFILTCNQTHKINHHMINRPGRLFYKLEFDGLDAQFVKEYAQDNLKNKEYIDSLVDLSSLFYKFNFDMLKAIVEEMNRYDESPRQAIAMLNISSAGIQGPRIYTASIFVNDEKISEQKSVSLNSMDQDLEMYLGMKDNAHEEILLAASEYSEYCDRKKKYDEIYNEEVQAGKHTEAERTYNLVLTQGDIIKLNVAKGSILYRKGDLSVALEEVKRKPFDIYRSI